MVQLKEHLLHDIATGFLGRNEFHANVEKFVLAGKEQFRVFRRIVAYDIAIEEFVSTDFYQSYRGKMYWHEPSFLNVMMLMWARKLRLRADHCLDYDQLYSSKNTTGSLEFEQLDVDGSRFDRWPEVLRAFPNLGILKVRAPNFALMLAEVPIELACLQEVELTSVDNIGNELLAAHTALSEHQNKLPSLDTIHYVDTPLKDIAFPDDANNVLSIKHLIIGAETDCCTPLDYSFLPAAQKMFPSLESVEIRVKVNDYWHYCNHPKLEVAKSFYEAFESLNVGFSIKVTYIDRIPCAEEDLTELRQFFATKGKVYGGLEKFAVETSVPGKRLTYEATISVRSVFDSDDDYEDDDWDEFEDFEDGDWVEDDDFEDDNLGEADDDQDANHE